jgi:superoxide dismutase, Cu-Zn family
MENSKGAFMQQSLRLIPALFVTTFTAGVMADIKVPMQLVDQNGVGTSVGQVTLSETNYGLVLTPSLQGLAAGVHGFHLHQNPSCAPMEKDGNMVAAGAAGGHYDPAQTNAHGTPWGEGHQGDLPPLYAEADGSINQPVLAPRLKLSDVRGKSLMIHAGGDNHADHPAPLGGGGARVACGVIE